MIDQFLEKKALAHVMSEEYVEASRVLEGLHQAELGVFIDQLGQLLSIAKAVSGEREVLDGQN